MSRIVVPAAFAVLLWASASADSGEPLPVKTVAFDAPSVGREMKYNVVLPADYATSDRRYPVLYLLHGLTSNYTAWGYMRVPEFAAEHDMIVVMPDVGNTWYVNWEVADDQGKHRWEDFIVNDLIGHVDAAYRTIDEREGRAINGLSMGGYGAIMLGLRHPDMFCSIGSHSGALGFARREAEAIAAGETSAVMRREWTDKPNPRVAIAGFNSPRERTPPGRPFATAEQCASHDPFQLVLGVEREQLPHIYLDCGAEDRLIGVNREFARLLMDNDIPFTYAQSKGGHLPPYWAREVGHSMAVQNHMIERAIAEKAKARARAEAQAGN